ncbi:MAG: putative metal-binding motif-containing protein [Sandaracinaceae bacterium]|nr:putative metal-binding motif-containing protein [Sandaracinaceae bacterium]
MNHVTHRVAVLVLGGVLAAHAGCPTDPPGGGVDARSGACTGDDDCSDGLFCNGRERCEPMSAGADGRGCVAPRGRPCLDVQLCEEADDRCVTDCGVERDADGDGLDAEECGGRDCDDADPLRFPGNVEVCDGEAHDEDCDATTFGPRDLDHDGAIDAACCNEDASGVRSCGEDCDDTRRNVRPTGIELCNGLDDDCNGMEDDGVLVELFVDADRDLHGATPRMSCPGVVGVSVVDDDCLDDPENASARAVHGAQLEICDGIDNDCDGRIDEHARPLTWYRDMDGDGFGSARSGTMVSCAPIDGFSLLPTDCDDGNRSISPAGVEICDGLDSDCNGLADFRVGVNDREDDDDDGVPDVACGGSDCDDDDPSARPGAPEICDDRDSDCDGLSDHGASPPPGVMADETAEIDWYADVDQDGFGAEAGAVRSCEPQPGRVTRGGDCDDADPTRHPGAIDGCDGVDDDCDGELDEDGVAIAYYADTDGDRDGDGMATIACRAPTGLTELPGDCAPTDPTRGPGLYETCNGIDDDCDMDVDEELFHDVDGDGHGDPMSPVVGACTAGDVGRGDDCNDMISSLHPELAETCNGTDDDCDGDVDEPGAELCATATGSHGMCVAGSCELTCAAGTADCDGDASNGCETSLATDPRHCGDCATDCGIGGTCGGMSGCDDPVVGVELGVYHACGWRRQGGVFCWGAADRIPGGTGGTTPVGIVGVDHVIDLAVTWLATCAVRSNGEVWCWGVGNQGHLGFGQEADGSYGPRAVPGITDAVEIEAALSTLCVRHATGNVTCWGESGWPGGAPDLRPSRLVGVTDARRILGSTNWWDMLIVGADGRTYHFGHAATFNATGSLDLRDVSGIVGSPPTSFATGLVDDGASGLGGCMLRESGTAACWGSNRVWADGDMVAGTLNVMRDVGPPWMGATMLRGTAGDEVRCGIFADGAVRCSGQCTGDNSRGDGCGVMQAVGTTVSGLDGTDDVVYLASQGGARGGGASFCAVTRSGDLFCWGRFPTTTRTEHRPVRVVTD